MLLEFRVRNFRSIREEQALSLVASSDTELDDTHVAATGLKAVPSVVRSAVVYGPNASGKSTLLFALNYMRAVVAESAAVIKPGQTFNVQPFKLDESFILEPTSFELTFLVDGIRHQYAFAMTAQRIVSESLVVYRSAKPTRWFKRQLAADGENYDYALLCFCKGNTCYAVCVAKVIGSTSASGKQVIPEIQYAAVVMHFIRCIPICAVVTIRILVKIWI